MRTPARAPRSSSIFSEGSDPHGQVALLLCESLFHLLVEQGILSHQAVLEALEGVAELIEEAADREFEHVDVRAAAVLVYAMRDSFLQKD